MSQILIQFSNLYMSFDSEILFENISLSIHQGEIFSLIGENGAGKTTLLKLLTCSIKPDSGNLVKASHLTIGFLPQEVLFDSLTTVREYIEGKTFSKLEQEMAKCLEDSNRLNEWCKLHEKYEQLGGYQRIPIEKVLTGLKINHLLDFPMNTLSSGQRVQVALAKSLIENPDLLLLDEPTNHLDSEMLGWLTNFLKERKGATLIVSHDRKFINVTCNRLIEIKNGNLTCFGGNYDFYLYEKDRILKKQIKAFEAQEEEKKLLKQKIKAITFSKADPSLPSDRNVMAYNYRGENHQKSLQHNLGILKSRLAEIEKKSLSHPKPKSIKGLEFSKVPLASTVAIELEEVSKAYGSKILFHNLNKVLCKGDHIILKGTNGCGKTTLLKCIAKLLSVDTGKIHIAPSVKIGYLDQEVGLLPMYKTPLEFFKNRFNLSEEELRRELHKSAIGGVELLFRPFSTHSIGQRKRLMLLTLILEKPNVLLLDEPTNHLDLLTLEALEEAICHFEGPVLAISHDARFIEKIATQIWEL